MAAKETRRPPRSARAAATGGLLLAGAVAFALASTIHFRVSLTLGPLVIDDPFRGAALPEAILAVVLAIAGAALLARRRFARRLALGATSFAFLTTLYGLSVTAGSGAAPMWATTSPCW